MSAVEELHGITPKEAIAKLKSLSSDSEIAHGDADLILLQVLTNLGAYEVAEAWEEARERIAFWYA